MTDMTAPAGQPPPSARTRQALRPDRVYLGWQYALQHPDPGPRPRRPTPPEQQQLNPGWLAAQHREENALNRPVKLAFAGALLLAAVLLAVWLAGRLTPLIAAPGIAACLLGAAMTGFATWQSRKALHVRIAGEQRRLGKIRAEQESRLFGWQEDHARAFQDWQARRAAYDRQPQWYAVSVPAGIDRVDVAGGTLSGWSALITTVGAARLSTGGEVTVIDLSEGAVAQDLAAMSRRFGIDPLVWILPGDLPRLDLGSGLGAAALADVLSLVVSVSEDQGSTRDLAYDNAILERVLQVLGSAGHEVTVGRVTAALRTLAQVGDPREDMARGLIDAAQVDAIGRLFGRGAADRVVIERAWTLESQLRKLEKLGTEPAGLPPARLRIVATDRRAGVVGNRVLGTYVVTAFTHMLRQASVDHAGGGAAAADPPQPWRHTVALAGAEKLRGDVLDRLCDACEQTRTGLVLGYRSIPAPVRERIGRGNAAVAFMRLGNAEEAKVASEQIGTEHRFVLSQLTETVGTSVTDTTGDSYTSTVGTADSVSTTASASETAGRSRGAGHSQESSMLPFGHSTRSRSRDASYSYGTSDSESITEGINTSSAWGVNTSRAAGSNESLARTSQRSREFLVEQHELQQLPPSAAIVSYAAKEGRRVVLADANPGILALPTATVLGLDEALRQPAADGPVPSGAGSAPDGPDGAYPPSPGPWDPGPSGTADFWPAARPWPGSPPAEAAPGAPGSGGAPDGRRRKPHAQVSWKGEDQPPPNLGPPPERLDWRKRRD
jgi:hypothetical protein